MKPVIEVKGLSKKYRIGRAEKRADTMIGAIVEGLKSPLKNLRNIRSLTRLEENGEDITWALRDVSFEVKEGEVLGIIGHNGAGKSTLLKILSRVTEPSAGEVTIRGRVAALLEVGTGFHPELTGLENIYMNGTILGMHKNEIDRKLDEIVDFSGVEKYLDTPVKFYSSGMRVRLGFAVAAHLESEILIVDEVLAVGDADFQRKCMGKMGSIASGGRTVLFVTHDLGAIQRLCPQSALLLEGRLEKLGRSGEIVQYYAGLNRNNGQRAPDRVPSANGLRVQSVYVENSLGQKTEALMSGEACKIVMECDSPETWELGHLNYLHIYFKSRNGANLFILSSKYSSTGVGRVEKSSRVCCSIDKVPLLPGFYQVDICLKSLDVTVQLIENALTINVLSGRFPGYNRLPGSSAGVFLVEHYWLIE